MKRRLIFTMTVALMLVATLSLPAMALTEQNITASVTVSQYISVTITGAAAGGIDFGSQIPGVTALETHSNNVTPSIIVTVDVGSTTNVTMQIKGADFTGTGTIPVNNAKYSLTYDGAKVDMTTGYLEFAHEVAPSGAAVLWHWLYIPSVTAGTYNSTFSYKAIPHS